MKNSKELNVENEKSKKIKIPIENVIFDSFKKHLDIPGNQRILFSGKFGVGKTYFLDKFFEKYSDEYEKFHLYPVNYQISGNEDILDLVKYDILVELAKYNDIFDSNKIEDFIDLRNLMSIWGSENRENIIKTVLSNVPKLGRPMKDTYLLIEKFLKFKCEFEEGEGFKVEKFLRSVESNVKETDNISKLIKDKISVIAKQESGDKKKNVLILDDLDRLDPEHIFRILNVFSAFFEQNGEENKFGFDKIVLAADYENLKNIFNHKYGEKTDSRGYFDKFFSVGIYDFDTIDIAGRHIDIILDAICTEDNVLKRALNNQSIFVGNILSRMIKLNLVSIREILRLVEFTLEDLLDEARFNNNNFANNTVQCVDFSVKILLKIIGNKKDLIDKLNTVKMDEISKDEGSDIIYTAYITSILRGVLGNEIMNQPALHYGDRYVLKKEGEKFVLSDGRSDKLFYDLLIEYIEKEKHIKNNMSDYEYL